MRVRSLVLFAFMLGGCQIEDDSGNSAAEAARVFGVTKTGSPNGASLTGIWETTTPLKQNGVTTVTRLELASDHVVIASKCSLDDGSAQPVTVGARVDANVSTAAIVVNQPGSASSRLGSNAVCGVSLADGTIPACGASQSGCFSLANGVLSLYQSSSTEVFGKVSD